MMENRNSPLRDLALQYKVGSLGREEYLKLRSKMLRAIQHGKTPKYFHAEKKSPLRLYAGIVAVLVTLVMIISVAWNGEKPQKTQTPVDTSAPMEKQPCYQDPELLDQLQTLSDRLISPPMFNPVDTQQLLELWQTLPVEARERCYSEPYMRKMQDELNLEIQDLEALSASATLKPADQQHLSAMQEFRDEFQGLTDER